MDKKDFKILIADDDEIAREVISHILSKEGYPVVTARDGLEAVRILRIDNIRLVITDLRMPGADGIEVLKNAVRMNPEVAVIILTAYATLDSTLEAMKEGAYDYLTKPFKVQEIIIHANRAYDRARLINENKELVRYVRETYRDMDVINAAVESGCPEITTSWIERIERLREMGMLTEQEKEILKERLVNGIRKS